MNQNHPHGIRRRPVPEPVEGRRAATEKLRAEKTPTSFQSKLKTVPARLSSSQEKNNDRARLATEAIPSAEQPRNRGWCGRGTLMPSVTIKRDCQLTPTTAIKSNPAAPFQLRRQPDAAPGRLPPPLRASVPSCLRASQGPILHEFANSDHSNFLAPAPFQPVGFLRFSVSAFQHSITMRPRPPHTPLVPPSSQPTWRRSTATRWRLSFDVAECRSKTLAVPVPGPLSTFRLRPRPGGLC